MSGDGTKLQRLPAGKTLVQYLHLRVPSEEFNTAFGLLRLLMENFKVLH